MTPIILTVIACKQADKQPKLIFKFISDSRCWNLYLTMLNGWTNGNSFIRLNNIRFSSLYNGEIYSPPLVKLKAQEKKSRLEELFNMILRIDSKFFLEGYLFLLFKPLHLNLFVSSLMTLEENEKLFFHVIFSKYFPQKGENC